MVTFVIAETFNGPPDIAQGGYACGMIARSFDGPSEVTLRTPIPLGCDVHCARDGEGIVVHDANGVLLAEASPTEIEDDVPDPVSVSEARAASGRYAGRDSAYPTCFVCGIDRTDGQRVFPGPVDNRDVVATPWTPPDAAPEMVWAALDCPSGWAVDDLSEPNLFLGRMSASIDGPIEPGSEHVLVGWRVAIDGRKRHSGSALFTAEGTLVARARATWIITAQ